MYRAMIFLGLLALLFLEALLVFMAALLTLLELLLLLSAVEVVPVGLSLGGRSLRVMPCLEEVVGVVVDDIFRFFFAL
ncbi:hypothetical protein FPQ18DRAFT_334433, partial [Pyronema domesticum]